MYFTGTWTNGEKQQQQKIIEDVALIQSKFIKKPFSLKVTEK